MTKTAAQQLGKHNINVNAICPGVTRSVLSDANLRVRAEQEGLTLEAMERERAEVIPLQRVNEPEDIAAMVVFLSSTWCAKHYRAVLQCGRWHHSRLGREHINDDQM